MAYQRKTHDEWEVHSNYGYGFEYTVTGDGKADAYRLLREYRKNQPQYLHKVIKKRYKNQ